MPVSRVRLVVPHHMAQKFPLFSIGTYADELGAAVTALGDSASLLDVKQTDITTGSLDDSGSVGAGVVAVQQIVSYGRGLKLCSSSSRIRASRGEYLPVASAVLNAHVDHLCGG